VKAGRNVGAIYVYTRNLSGQWTSGTEVKKISPTTKVAGTFFGTSVDVLENTLIAGATTNGSPGKVFVIQSKDYFWQNTIQLLQLEGDTFAEDLFGHAVALDQDDFFLAAPKETNCAGSSSGTVYVTQPPPLY
jgi:hypothetical protein